MTQTRTDRPQAMIFQVHTLDEKVQSMRNDDLIKTHGRDASTLVRDPKANIRRYRE